MGVESFNLRKRDDIRTCVSLKVGTTFFDKEEIREKSWFSCLLIIAANKKKFVAESRSKVEVHNI